MDKNLVNIDDLVRQRLAGAEEKERAGAWARMSELLDEEMPRKRGIFFWRSRYGALGVLLLAGAIGLGGYELNSLRNMNNGSTSSMVASALNTKNNIPAGTASATEPTTENINPTNNTINNTGTAATTPAAYPSGNVNSTANNSSEHTRNNSYTGTKPLNNAGAPAGKSDVTVPANNHNTHTNGIAMASSDASDHTITAKRNNEVEPVAATNNVASTAATKASIPADKSAGTAKNTPAKSAKTGTGTATETAKAQIAIAGNDGIVTEKNGTTSASDGEIAATTSGEMTAPEKAISETTTDNSIAAENKDRTKKTATKGHTVAVKEEHNTNGTKAGRLAKESATAKKGAPATTATTPGEETAEGNPGDENQDMPVAHKTTRKQHDLAVLSSSSVAGSRTVAVNLKPTTAPMPGPKATSAVTAHPKPAGNNKAAGNAGATSVHPKNNPPATVSTPANTVAASVGSNKTGAPVTFTNRIPGPAKAEKKTEERDPVKEMSVANTRKQKRVIEKMVVLQRFLSNTPREHALRMDTISIESITEEYEVANAQTAAKAAEEVAPSENPDMDSSPMKPMASSESFATTMKEAGSKQPKGAKTLENLSAAFNDIKYNAGHATFAMGVTGGINRTFFGPNNFMGFQFGLYGALSFSQSLGLMAELKYFNRINNGFSLHDDYYQYTAQPGGGYKREMVSNPYDISTLHSIELPIAVRYTTGRFNFAVGPNVVYTFNINSGNYRTVDPNATSTFVSTVGNDNNGKIQASDFNSRFGLGYLFGVSYQVSPKVTIDLRDVQTLWDNAKTDGAKEVSSKLFRSPSFQLSLGYRIGGGKREQ